MVSNLSRIFEVTNAINELRQEELEFTKFLEKFQSLWAELDMLRPTLKDPKVLNERREKDKIFGLLLNLYLAYNYLIRHILRENKLQSFEEVCSRIQKKQGSIGLFGGKSELVSTNTSVLKVMERVSRAALCEHCKKKGHHNKENCCILHSHLKPSKIKDPMANLSQEGGNGQPSTSTHGLEMALSATVEYVKKSVLEELIKAYVMRTSTST